MTLRWLGSEYPVERCEEVDRRRRRRPPLPQAVSPTEHGHRTDPSVGNLMSRRLVSLAVSERIDATQRRTWPVRLKYS